MAGIIGTMTAQARLRRGRKEILSDKCVYILKPFSSNGFDPNIHNKFVMARNSLKMIEESLSTSVFSVVKRSIFSDGPHLKNRRRYNFQC